MKFYNYLEELITESINDKGIMHASFFAGTPGAGKSFVRKKIKAGTIEPRVVNTDKFSEFFDERGVDWELYGDKVKQLTQNQLIQYINSLLPLWIDGTSSNPSAVFRRQGILKSIGYDTAMVWIETSLETALERNRQRERQVSEDFIKKTYEKIAPLKDYYKSEFKNFKVINNDKGALTEDVILDAYKKMEKFFSSPIENPIGKELQEEMMENGYKYLAEHPEYDLQYVKKLVSNWYKR